MYGEYSLTVALLEILVSGGDLDEGLVDVRGVCDCCLVGNTSIGVALLEDLVNV
jgi:hypothetical protein